MRTLRLAVDANNLDSSSSRAAIDCAAEILRNGGLVAFPTETVYGLGANALNPSAVEKIFVAKQRPAWDPLIVHISDAAMLSSVLAYDEISHCANALMNAFWPGPLTLLLPKADAIPPMVTAGRLLVGIRIPTHPVAQALIHAAGFPIAAPSANSFGRISPTLPAHVLEDLDGRIDAVLDSGETTHGLESTVVDASGETPIVYRPGIITLQQIRAVCGSAVQWKSPAQTNDLEEVDPESQPSPGTGIRHYAPRARLILIGGEGVDQVVGFAKALENAAKSDTNSERSRIGVMLPSNFFGQPLPNFKGGVVVYEWGNWMDLPLLAHRLYAGLRYLDSAGVSTILCPLPPAGDVGTAIRDRLQKAAKTSN
jgi:L-threonylcarbamoyladenylate synthase